MDFSNRVGFTIGTGRCGTLFLYQLMEKEPEVAISHERNPDNETFHRYCRWNDLPVDDEGFLATKEKEILADLENHTYSFEASPYLSLSVRELHQRFGARFLFLVRRPDRVVTSFVHKGFYRHPYIVKNPELAAGYQDQSPEKFYTFLARISPQGEDFEIWNDMTRVGKVAWFWKAFNERILELLQELPEESYRLVRIEDFDYPKYHEVSDYLGFNSTITQAEFDTLRAGKPHAFWRKRNVDQWSEQEISEFEGQVGDLAERFGYEYRIANLVEEARSEKAEAMRLGHIPQEKKGPQFWRLRRTTADWLQNLARMVDVT